MTTSVGTQIDTLDPNLTSLWLIIIVPLMQVPPTATTDALIEELESLRKDLDDFEDKYKFFSERFKAALDLVRSYFNHCDVISHS